MENARSLLYYAGWAGEDAPGGVPAGGQRGAHRRRAGRSTSPRGRTSTAHGGIGATWEHDAPLYFRRAQL